ncbi:MAG TPA: PilZ domain-containing protein [Bryobacteraceae bacterium]|jgi:hypothetical protein
MYQRASQRYQIEATAIMRQFGKPGLFLVTILDVSASGLRLSSPIALPSGTRVTLVYQKTELAGEIRYFREVEDGQVNLGVSIETAIGPGAPLENEELNLVPLFNHGTRQVARMAS